MFYLLDESYPCETPRGMKIVDSEMTLFGDSLCLRIGLAKGPAKLSDIVPLVYLISDKICQLFINKLADDGRNVPCQKGCSYCCEYLVALSLPEVYYMQKELAASDGQTQASVLDSCLRSAQRMLSPENLQKHHVVENVDIADISQWYKELELSCPFLSDGFCGIYEKRPLACREHMVTSPPRFCEKALSGAVEVVRLPVSLLEVLGQLAAELEQTQVEAVFLPLVPACVEQYKERAERTWPAERLVERFLRIMEAHLLESTSQTVAAKGL